jgi:hypothetical protein
MKFRLDLPSRTKPTIHLNKKCSKMMIVINREIAVIYNKGKEVNGFVEWNQINRIKQHPTLLQGSSTLPFLFCPNFDKYIDINFA